MANKVFLPKKWLIIGPGSMVGSRFLELLEGDTIIFGAGGGMDLQVKDRLRDFEELDLTDPEKVLKTVDKFDADYILNFAAVTAVDETEKSKPANPDDPQHLEQNLAYRVNVLGTRNLLDAAKSLGKFPIFISTGFVFDGDKGPYSEDADVAKSPDQVSWYGWTKILAERATKESGIDSLTLRISYPYRSQYEGKADFARTFVNLYDDVKSGKREGFYPLFADQQLTPTFIDDLPQAISTLIENKAKGIYHIASPTLTTPYDFACKVLEVTRGVGNPGAIIPKGSIVEFQKARPELAKRPVHGGELSAKISKLGFTPTTWEEGIVKAYSQNG